MEEVLPFCLPLSSSLLYSGVCPPWDTKIGFDPFKKLLPCVALLWMEVSLVTVNQQIRGSDTSDARTAASHLLISSLVHVSGSPFGSSEWGNTPPQIDQTPTAVIKPVKAIQNIACQYYPTDARLWCMMWCRVRSSN